MNQETSMHSFKAGASQVDMTPQGSVSLYGYPLVPRMSTGINDPLYASAIYLHDGKQPILMIGTDLIYMTRDMANPIRQRLSEMLDMPEHAIVISASHTHSGPPTMQLSWINNDQAPMFNADKIYCQQVVEAVIKAGSQAAANAVPAQVGFSTADGSKLGTNRRDPNGPSIPQMPLLIARDLNDQIIGIMVSCNMHPTVLHEDSTLISGDFPGLAREYLQSTILQGNKPLIYHMGASGNQSPRHVVKANTLEECHRLGHILGKEIENSVAHAQWHDHLTLTSTTTDMTLPVRQIDDMDTAKAKLQQVENKLESQRQSGAPKTTIRTTECDWFGALERVLMVQANEDGLIEKLVQLNMPASVQIIAIGNQRYVCWPGEVFVEFALEVIQQFPQANIITCANGELQGYLVTQQAVDEDAYEANNAIFQSPQGGDTLVQTTLNLLNSLQKKIS
ncbi:MAG: neutral/alkaline non-lysosomal ceramidase N-terminal domain-containing protein [Phycisphaeraceae bacterium]|nr:neutral/alkaline non-lysosomal ceramidase N-terminal domain-containing protein [Phycisphaeraceae bacterium]